MFRTLLLWAALCLCPLAAQFANLTATDDGSAVFFDSTLSLKSAGQITYAQSFIYRLDGSGVSLFAQGQPPSSSVAASGNAPGPSSPWASGDGTIVAYTLNGTGVVQGAPITQLGKGSPVLSRSGRWAVLYPTDVTSNAPGIRFDLRTGDQVSVPSAPTTTSRRPFLASDGTVFGMAQGRFGLYRNGAFAPIDFSYLGGSSALSFCALSDNGQKLFYTKRPFLPGHSLTTTLAVLDIASGIETTLSTTDQIALFLFLGASNDGRWALFILTRPEQYTGDAFIADTQTGQLFPITLVDGELAGNGTLSGNANRVFLVTSRNRLLVGDVTAGQTTNLQPWIPETPFLANSAPHWLVPGSLATLPIGFVPPGNLQVSIDGQPAPIVTSDDATISIQVPWDQHSNPLALLKIEPSGDSPFASEFITPVFPLSPQLLQVAPRNSFSPFFLKQDFSVLDSNPAPGQILEAYFTGLGPVRESIATGAPAPTDHPVALSSTLRCRFGTQADYAKTQFAGLAPGFIGIYQTAFQMNADAGGPILSLSCYLEGPVGSAGFGIGVLTVP